MKHTLALVLMVFGSFGAFAQDAYRNDCGGKEGLNSLCAFFDKDNNMSGFYDGAILNSKRHGLGKYVDMLTGAIYEGKWIDDKISQGTLTYPSGAIYKGQFINGKRNGQGEVSNGAEYKYVGEFKDDKIHGYGTLNSNLLKYSGEWKDDSYHGQGTMIHNTGTKYEGEWLNGKKHGYGTISNIKNDYEYTGEFKNYKFDGLGVLRLSGSLYTGGWKQGKKNGQGTRRYSDSLEYSGEWKDDDYHGQGTINYYETNSKYIGEWKQSKKHGQGIYIIDGKTISGKWKNDNLLSSNSAQLIPRTNLSSQQREREVRALMNLGAIIGGAGTPAPSSTRSSVTTSSYPTYTSSRTVPSNQLCPMLASPVVKQEVVRGNRICYYQ